MSANTAHFYPATFAVGGLRRRAQWHWPSDADAPGLIIALHEGDHVGLTMAGRWAPYADRNVAIVCPTALRNPARAKLHGRKIVNPRAWAVPGDDRRCDGQYPRQDIDLLIEIIDTAVDRGVDPAKVVVTGFSSGAELTWAALHTIPYLLAAVAPCGRCLPVDPPWVGALVLGNTRPVSILGQCGVDDITAPYEGGGTKGYGAAQYLDWWETMRVAARAQGCTGTPVQGYTGKVATVEYVHPDPRISVVGQAAEGVGHRWAGADARIWEWAHTIGAL